MGAGGPDPLFIPYTLSFPFPSKSLLKMRILDFEPRIVNKKIPFTENLLSKFYKLIPRILENLRNSDIQLDSDIRESISTI